MNRTTTGKAPGMAQFMTLCAAAGLTLLAPPARAEASAVSPAGFTVTHAHVLDSTPERVYKAITELPRWWNSSHTWSGQASNLSLDAQVGGCFCERWGSGAAVMHGQVVMVLPGQVVRLHAWLGPLHEQPVQAVLTFGTTHREGATRLRVTYRVAGAPDAGLDKLAGPVDKVLGEQVARLKAYIETGKPD